MTDVNFSLDNMYLRKATASSNARKMLNTQESNRFRADLINRISPNEESYKMIKELTGMRSRKSKFLKTRSKFIAYILKRRHIKKYWVNSVSVLQTMVIKENKNFITADRSMQGFLTNCKNAHKRTELASTSLNHHQDFAKKLSFCVNSDCRPETSDLRVNTGREICRKNDNSFIIRRIDHIEESLDRVEMEFDQLLKDSQKSENRKTYFSTERK